MRALIGVLLHPRRTAPPPLAIDLRVVALAGALLWTVAGVVCVVLASSGSITWRPVETCAAGVVLGLVGAAWARRQGPDGQVGRQGVHQGAPHDEDLDGPVDGSLPPR
ncbi:DUF2530 domain-containing protein [Cellulomonas marina]|uniref:DUF2530 domain-containing protein n=1 Tax=Cellulomonas marina TaxID=988821 RepID=A0A1I0WJZ2_9CELL|nr:DUF2530 domain-containing protein [Cellulomonas marina]GIG27682.1 hypothetical protein Cma02nite_02820 [Cellulomonas marina]SFA88548.1 Protein of unknown function [Cellulomonas marina]